MFGTNLQFYRTENDQGGCWSCTPLWVNLIKSNWRLKRILHNLKDQKKKIRKIWSWSTAEWDGLSTSSKQKAWETDLIWFKKKKKVKETKPLFFPIKFVWLGWDLLRSGSWWPYWSSTPRCPDPYLMLALIPTTITLHSMKLDPSLSWELMIG